MVQPIAQIYRKPREAISGDWDTAVVDDRLIARHPAFEYKHKWAALGGCDTATCKFRLPELLGHHVLREYVGNRIAFHFENPLVPEWEGLVRTISYNLAGKKYIHTLDNFGNVLTIRSQAHDQSPNANVINAVYDEESAAIYGYKTLVFDIGAQFESSAGLPGAIQTAYQNRVSRPIKTTHPAPTSGMEVQIDCVGMYHTWKWVIFNQTTGSPITDTVGNGVWYLMFTHFFQSATNIYAGYNSAAGRNLNGTGAGYGVFYNSEDWLDTWVSNSAFNVDKTRQGGETNWDRIMQFVEGGDGVDPWVVGIEITDPNRGYRRAYYRASNQTVEYFDYPHDPANIYDRYGRRVPPWKVRPDRILSSELNPLGLSSGEFRYTYLKTVTYDSNSPQPITYTSDYDMSWRGLFGGNQSFRTTDDIWGYASKQRMWY